LIIWRDLSRDYWQRGSSALTISSRIATRAFELRSPAMIGHLLKPELEELIAEKRWDVLR
jgi:hypothetical protein